MRAHMLAYMQGGVARVAGRDARWPRRAAPACGGRPGRLRAHRRHRALALRRRRRLPVQPRLIPLFLLCLLVPGEGGGLVCAVHTPPPSLAVWERGRVRQRKGEHALWSLNRQGALCSVNHVWLVIHRAIAMFCSN